MAKKKPKKHRETWWRIMYENSDGKTVFSDFRYMTKKLAVEALRWWHKEIDVPSARVVRVLEQEL